MWWQVSYINFFSSWRRGREAVIYHHWNRILIIDVFLTFLPAMFLPAILTVNTFIHHHRNIVPLSIASTKEVRERDVYGFHWSHHVYHHLQAHALTEW